jgi:hypothetical protein
VEARDHQIMQQNRTGIMSRCLLLPWDFSTIFELGKRGKKDQAAGSKRLEKDFLQRRLKKK